MPSNGIVPLHRLTNISCSTSYCLELPYRAMEIPQDGWLKLGQDPNAVVPLDLIAFITRGVSVALSVSGDSHNYS